MHLTYFEDTESILHEFVEDDYSRYPVDPIHLPYQKDTKDYTLENVIQDYWLTLCEKHTRKRLHEKGIRLSGIQNAYRYGYRLAERLYGKYAYNGINGRRTLEKLFDGMLDEWHKITTRYDAEHLVIEGSDYGLREIRFTVDTRPKDKPKIITSLFDDVWRKYPLEALIAY